MGSLYRHRIRGLFVSLDMFIRLVFNPSTKNPVRTVWGYLKLCLLERFQPGRETPVKLLGRKVSYGSLFFLRHLYREIFIERLYARHKLDQADLIIDAGANIGMSMLWYAQQYPAAKIICFEPDPLTFAILQENIQQNNLTNVEAHNVAVADRAGTLTFYYDENLRGGDVANSVNKDFRASLADKPKMAERTVPAVPLRDYLQEPVGILKIDIEGSEGSALKSCREELYNVALLQMEYHYLPNNTLEDVLETLETAGLRYRLYLDGPLENVLGRVAMVYATNQAELAG